LGTKLPEPDIRGRGSIRGRYSEIPKFYLPKVCQMQSFFSHHYEPVIFEGVDGGLSSERQVFGAIITRLFVHHEHQPLVETK